MPRSTQQCLISFGSNLGNRDTVLGEAATLIAVEDCVNQFAASRLFETPPIGGPSGQEPFLNAVAALETNASAATILAKLQAIEDKLGRLRKDRWGSRSIDLDVVLHGELIGGSSGLVVPHPRYTARRFVLRPACDVAGHFRDPRFGWSLQQLADHLDLGVPSMAMVGSTESQRGELCDRLATEAGLTIFKSPPDQIPTPIETAWISDFVPSLPPADSELANSTNTPRLLARLQATEPKHRWPAPHQMWPSGRQWPEYRLELDDMDWAASEIASAIQSMRCPLNPVTEDGNWWR